MRTYLWTPPAVPSLPVRGRSERFPVHRLFFVGRNYHPHAVEMGRPVDRAVERPFYFTKSPQTLLKAARRGPTRRRRRTFISRWSGWWPSAAPAFASMPKTRTN